MKKSISQKFPSIIKVLSGVATELTVVLVEGGITPIALPPILLGLILIFGGLSSKRKM